MNKIFTKLLSHALGIAYHKSFNWAAAGATLGGALLGGGGKKSNSAPKAAPFYMNNGLFKLSMDKKGISNMGATGALGDFQSGQVGDAAYWSEMAKNDPGAQAMQQYGQDIFNNMQAWDPNQIAQMQYQNMQPIFQDEYNQQNLDMENRLFSRGRFGSDVGALQQNALYDAQNDNNRKLYGDAFGMGLMANNQMYNQGANALAGSQGLISGWQTLGGNALNNVLNVQNAATGGFSALGGARGGNPGGGSYSPTQMVGAGLLNAGVQGLDFSGFGAGSSSGGLWDGGGYDFGSGYDMGYS
jgi:hypothetical protein